MKILYSCAINVSKRSNHRFLNEVIYIQFMALTIENTFVRNRRAYHRLVIT